MLLVNKRIFLVEDNIANRAIEQMILEQQGAKTAVDRWGTDTITRLREFMPVDVILLDLMFPNQVSGYDIFTQIRSCAELKHIPIVAVSASDPNEAIARTKGLGFSGFIAKPVNFDLFPRQIADVLDGKPIWQSSTKEAFK